MCFLAGYKEGGGSSHSHLCARYSSIFDLFMTEKWFLWNIFITLVLSGSMSPWGVCPPPSVDLCLVRQNPVNLMHYCPKPAVFGSVISPHAQCCHCPCQMPHWPAPENNPRVILLFYGTVFLFVLFKLYCNPVIIPVSLPIAANVRYIMSLMSYVIVSSNRLVSFVRE
jgi:hypothetical protein